MIPLRGASVVLIQPPEPVPAATALDNGGGVSHRFCPPWNLLCLKAFLDQRTAHPCTLVDTRLFDQLEQRLSEAITSIPQPRVAVINTSTIGLGEANAVIEVLHRTAPDVFTVLCGQHPSDYPRLALSLPHVHYGLCGDPEPILRNLLDYHDVESRLKLIPGLASHLNPQPEAYWLPDLRSLNLPQWTDVDWASYGASSTAGLRMDIHLSRGHPRTAADQARGGPGEPFREWPMDRVVANIQRCAHHGIIELFVNEPLGAWTESRLQAWARQLISVRSSQAWATHLLPAELSQETLDLLIDSHCRRIEVVFPSCDPDRLKSFGGLFDLEKIKLAIQRIQTAGIRVQIRFWVGGPGERAKEADRLIKAIQRFDHCPYFLYPFPYEPSAPMYHRDHDAVVAAEPVEHWLQWAKDPWLADRPTAFWSGREGAEACQKILLMSQRHIQFNLPRRLKKLVRHVRSINWIAAWERRVADLMFKRAESH